eukprot:12891647-Alexandrium_andersonii.AAC.1
MEEDGAPSRASPSTDPMAGEGASTEEATWQQRPDPIGIWAASTGGQGWRPGIPVSATTALALELAGALRR